MMADGVILIGWTSSVGGRERSSHTVFRDAMECWGRPQAAGEIEGLGAVGGFTGDGDVPCPGDLLLAALAACQETTLRMVAATMGIDLEELEVPVESTFTLESV
jgi:organic hydroperoxide reductase OsmC/OhrA